MKKAISFVLFLLMVVASCQDLGEPWSPDCDPPAQIDATIVVGESIARIRIGDTRCDVVRKVGQPTRILDGDMRGEIYLYESGPLKLTKVSISDDPGLGLGVISVEIEGGYGGITHDGIGMKSERSFVISKLGMPDSTRGQPLIEDFYNSTSNKFIFTYENQRVLRIYMLTQGPFF